MCLGDTCKHIRSAKDYHDVISFAESTNLKSLNIFVQLDENKVDLLSPTTPRRPSLSFTDFEPFLLAEQVSVPTKTKVRFTDSELPDYQSYDLFESFPQEEAQQLLSPEIGSGEEGGCLNLIASDEEDEEDRHSMIVYQDGDFHAILDDWSYYLAIQRSSAYVTPMKRPLSSLGQRRDAGVGRRVLTRNASTETFDLGLERKNSVCMTRSVDVGTGTVIMCHKSVGEGESELELDITCAPKAADEWMLVTDDEQSPSV